VILPALGDFNARVGNGSNIWIDLLEILVLRNSWIINRIVLLIQSYKSFKKWMCNTVFA